MNQFYLNNAVGAPSSVVEGARAVRGAMCAFGQIVSHSELNVSPKIVLDKDPDLIKFGEFFLGELLASIKDRDERRYAYAIMNGSHPMEDLFGMNDNDLPLFDAEYKYEGRDATNIAIAWAHKGLLLSFAFSEDLRQNALTIVSTAAPSDDYPSSFSMPNLHGGQDNITFIEKNLRNREGIKLKLFDEIRVLGFIHCSLERTFNGLTPDIQYSIVKGFKDAINKGLLIPHAGDGNNAIIPDANLIRYESHTDHEQLFEVAIEWPLTLRVFIAQDKGELYILDIKSKKEMGDGGVKQNQALKAAEKRFITMKKTS